MDRRERSVLSSLRACACRCRRAGANEHCNATKEARSTTQCDTDAVPLPPEPHFDWASLIQNRIERRARRD